MKNKKISEIILIILSLIVIYILVRNSYKDIASSLIHANVLYLIIAFVLFFLYLLFQAIPFYFFARVYDKRLQFPFFIYLMIVTNFFNGITPLATGGQPLQVYELHRNKMNTVDATNVVIQHTIVYEVAVVVWMILATIINFKFHIFPLTNSLKALATIGFILNIMFLVILIIISFSKNFNKILVSKTINILSKLHIIKNKEQKEEKWMETCNQFYNNSKLLLQKKHLFISGIIFLIIGYALFYMIPYFIFLSLGLNTTLSCFQVIIVSAFIAMSSSYLPIPGATGGVEYSFLGYFKTFIFGYKIKTALLLWRFITYYLPTIIGGFVFNIYTLGNKKRTSK